MNQGPVSVRGLWAYNKNLVSILFAVINSLMMQSGGRLNKKDGLTRYGDSHVKDKTS